mmetsp:Transcript_19575/g.24689  ORF Transcript_19575/g.24689 Transcript_19575/m.24689 type:complete len:343 (+) Transcript_19575:176-1204(+)|eukprot:CAMPEP_0203635716 /NCGR_PEP_ID=MMETSP0088-20131115/2448_1 /ASSEMBLY_ACC=CAM_ASM_001087 /TAXON_ID=426623 /ORGANISM="Chaetoceros affinis, Strain CCMP159" /LENGTH=342 /DNA_ID=CAMNT_0050489687 /DNA_START=108 /DNA_END=1136 /DNA_ORIENTATION=-
MKVSTRWSRTTSSSISNLFLPLSALLILSLSSFFADAQEAAPTTTTATAQKTFKIYHSLGQSKPFIPRGTIILSTSDGVSSGDGEVTTTIENDQDCLGPNALQDMDDLVSEDGFYRIKIVDEQGASVDSGRERSILASVPGCEVRRANFREQIELSLSQTGSLLSMSYTPLVSPLAAKCEELSPLSSNDREYTFQTLLSYSTSTPGMTLPKILPKMRPPPGLNVIKQKRNPQSSSSPDNTNNNNNGQKPGLYLDDEEEKKKQQENQSFLRKYWYIILPTVIMLFLGGEEPPPPQQPQQQQQRQRPGGATAPAGGGGATMPASGSGGGGGASGNTRQRRGKRG